MIGRIFVVTTSANRLENGSGEPVTDADQEGSWVVAFNHGLVLVEEHEEAEEELRHQMDDIFPSANGWVTRRLIADEVLPETRAGPFVLRWTVERVGGNEDREGDSLGEHIELGDPVLPPGGDTGEFP